MFSTRWRTPESGNNEFHSWLRLPRAGFPPNQSEPLPAFSATRWHFDSGFFQTIDSTLNQAYIVHTFCGWLCGPQQESLCLRAEEKKKRTAGFNVRLSEREARLSCLGAEQRRIEHYELHLGKCGRAGSTRGRRSATFRAQHQGLAKLHRGG